MSPLQQLSGGFFGFSFCSRSLLLGLILVFSPCNVSTSRIGLESLLKQSDHPIHGSILRQHLTHGLSRGHDLNRGQGLRHEVQKREVAKASTVEKEHWNVDEIVSMSRLQPNIRPYVLDVCKFQNSVVPDTNSDNISNKNGNSSQETLSREASSYPTTVQRYAYDPAQTTLTICGLDCSSLGVLNISNTEISKVELLASHLGAADLGSCLTEIGLNTENINSINITASDIQHLRISSKQFPSLQVLDLRSNVAVSTLHIDENLQISELYLSDNRWICTMRGSGRGAWSQASLQLGRHMAWLTKDKFNTSWRDRLETKCSSARADKWFQNSGGQAKDRRSSPNQGASDRLEDTQPQTDLSADYPTEPTETLLIEFLTFAVKTLDSCPKNCDCELAKPLASENQYTFKVSVDCSWLDLTELPGNLPEHTVYLDVSCNRIQTLHQLQTSPYRHLVKFNAWNNSISSMEDFRHSWILKNKPTEIDIRRNNVTQFDISIWEPLMERHSLKQTKVATTLHFLFSDNRWDCHCETIAAIQDFLVKYSVLLSDSSDMECDGINVLVKNYDYKDRCSPERGDLMIWVVVFELVLLIAVVAKLSWDIMVYRQTGRLPCIANYLCVNGFSNSIPRMGEGWRGNPWRAGGWESSWRGYANSPTQSHNSFHRCKKKFGGGGSSSGYFTASSADSSQNDQILPSCPNNSAKGGGPKDNSTMVTFSDS